MTTFENVVQIFTVCVAAIVIAALCLSLVAFVYAPHDDTDPVGGRSGLVLYTDCLTGLQYIGTPRGGIIERLNTDGRQIINSAGCSQ